MIFSKSLGHTALPLLAILLSGCAASVRTPSATTSLQAENRNVRKIALTMKGSDAAGKSTDWELFKAEWKTAMAESTKSAGLDFSYHEAEPKSGSDRAASVVVLVNDYRYISPGARYGFGVMTGNAYIESVASFRDLKSGKSLGTKEYSTSSTAWQGAFSAMTDKQVRAICDQIVKDAANK